jgi:hypothetical protein
MDRTIIEHDVTDVTQYQLLPLFFLFVVAVVAVVDVVVGWRRRHDDLTTDDVDRLLLRVSDVTLLIGTDQMDQTGSKISRQR